MRAVNNILAPIKNSPRRKRIKQKPLRFSPILHENKAKTVIKKKLEPSGICPKCKVFVDGSDENDGVVCASCNAYWHFSCAEVSNEILENEWADVEFMCEHHRSVSHVSSLVSPHVVNNCCDKTDDHVISDIKVHDYSLNINKKLKEKLKNLDTVMSVEVKDNGGQYTISINSTSYQLIVVNMLEFGGCLGTIEIPRTDVDNGGNGVQDRYILSVKSKFQLSITCYHTTSSLLLQIMGNRTSEKLALVEKFVTVDFVNQVRKMEKSGKYAQSRNILEAEIKKELQERSQHPAYSCLNEQDEGEDDVVITEIDESSNQNEVSLVNEAEQLSLTNEPVFCALEDMLDGEDKCASDSSCSDIIKANAVAVIPKKSQCGTSTKKVMDSFNVLNQMENNESDRNKFLWNLIMKLKVKGDELKSQQLLTYYPCVNSKINDFTLQLVDKQKDNDKLKKKLKELENPVKD